MAKQKQKAKTKAVVKKDNNTVTKLFPVGDRPTAAKTKTVDSLKKLGYTADPSTVHRVDGTKNTSITFRKPKKK